MEWNSAARFSVILIGIFAAAALAIFVFDAVLARVGLGAAVGLLVLALWLVYRRSKRHADLEREKLERS
jgi:Flp pilus assembly protein TadB